MANSWLRLWHDMPNDPKWRTIARVSGCSISEVIAVYIHILVDASTAVKRGETHCNAEDVSSALDLEIDKIEAILEAMQGRVLDGDRVAGWEQRQPQREDNSTDRVREWREKHGVTQRNAVKRNVTLDKDKDKSINTPQPPRGGRRRRNLQEPGIYNPSKQVTPSPEPQDDPKVQAYWQQVHQKRPNDFARDAPAWAKTMVLRKETDDGTADDIFGETGIPEGANAAEEPAEQGLSACMAEAPA